MDKSTIEDRSIPVPETGCWLWEGSCASHGYGDLRVDNKLILAHRASYELFNGKIPEGMFVMHKCDVKLCVNPAHLVVGTNTDNMRDKCAKGRWAGQGPKKLTKADVIEIRKMRSAGSPLSDIAKLFNVHSDHIRKITNFKIWKDA